MKNADRNRFFLWPLAAGAGLLTCGILDYPDSLAVRICLECTGIG